MKAYINIFPIKDNTGAPYSSNTAQQCTHTHTRSLTQTVIHSCRFHPHRNGLGGVNHRTQEGYRSTARLCPAQHSSYK